jgi:hypothetical protein
MTITEAIHLLRNSDLAKLDEQKLQELHATLESHPSILGFDGCTDALDLLAAERQRRSRVGTPADSEPADADGTSRQRGRRHLAPLVAVAIVALGGMFLVAWLRGTRNGEPAPSLVAASSPETPVQPGTPNPAPPAPPSAEKPPPEPTPELTTASRADSPATPEPDPQAISAADPLEAEAFPELEVTGAGANLTRDPVGGFLLSAINGPDLVKPVGTASRLALGDINGEPTIDLCQLTTKHLEFHGTINGSPRISLKAPAGTVVFHRNVGGSAHLHIVAPDGAVTFHAPVNGGARLTISARSVEFAAGLDGGAAADLTLTPGGTLSFTRLNGGSSLTHRKSHPDDPPTVITGDPSGNGRLIEAPPPANIPD